MNKYSKYITIAEETEKEVLRLRNSNSPPWTHLKTLKNLKMFGKSSPHFNGNMYKFLTEIDYPHEIVYEVMSPPATPEEKAWDKSLKHYERLTSISDDLAIGLLVTPPAALGLISKREFVDLQIFKRYPSDELNEGNSVSFAGRSPAADCIRGTNYPGGYAVAQNKRNPYKCFVELYVNCDIGGSIPRSVVEAYLPHQQISYLNCLKTEVKRRLDEKRKD